jgi:hypothetical protein
MNEKTKTGLEILQAALLLGILGDVMLRSEYPGVNMLLLVGGTAAAMAMLFLRRRRAELDTNTWALLGAMVFFGAMCAWRESPQLVVGNVLAIIVIFAVLLLPVLRIKLATAGVSHYILGFIFSALNAFFAPFLIIFDDVKWTDKAQKGWAKTAFSVFRGILIAGPLLLVFGALFMAADAAFEGLVKRTFNINFDTVLSHVFLTGFLAWLASGYLRGTLVEPFSGVQPLASIVPAAEPEIVQSPPSVTELPSEEPQAKAEAPEPEKKPRDWQNYDNSRLPKGLTLDSVEIGVVLGLVDLLFLAFVVLQVPYLFGGMDLVQNTPDFKLAEFARRGFGELVAVAALVLPILLATHWLLKKDSPLASKLFKVLAGVQIGLLFVIMASAAQRMLLLTGPLGYGMTTVRFYPMVFMIWLAVIFGWFAVTVMRGTRQHFAWGALWSALFVLGALHVFNPDAFIARRNIQLMQQGRDFDARYNVYHLSADAVPALLEGLSSMNLEDQCTTSYGLLHRESLNYKDFRAWNWSRRVAAGLIEPNRESLVNWPCPSTAAAVESAPVTSGTRVTDDSLGVPGRSVGPIILGMSREEVEKIIPFRKNNDAFQKRGYYTSAGGTIICPAVLHKSSVSKQDDFELFVYFDYDRVVQIEGNSPRYRLQNGIKYEDRFDTVRKVYSNAEMYVLKGSGGDKVGGKDFVYLVDKATGLAFEFRYSGKVKSMVLHNFIVFQPNSQFLPATCVTAPRQYELLPAEPS